MGGLVFVPVQLSFSCLCHSPRNFNLSQTHSVDQWIRASKHLGHFEIDPATSKVQRKSKKKQCFVTSCLVENLLWSS